VSVALPLAVDIGATQLRIAAFHADAGNARLRAIAVRPIAEDVVRGATVAQCQLLAAMVEDAVSELGTRERRAIAAIGAPEAVVRPLSLPKMNLYERQRAAQFESRRYVDFPRGESLVRVSETGTAGTYALGIASKSAVGSRVASLRAGGLKPCAIDHEAFALLRAFPTYAAVLDVGYRRTSLHVRSAGGVPATYHLLAGGDVVTKGIATDLAIDETSAERRKRMVGTAGAGETARRELATEIVRLFSAARSVGNITRAVMTGNGGRVAGLLEDVESFTGCTIDVSASGALRGAAYPDDVVSAKAADWNMLAGLALWGRV
jgi:Tfp pilus assembly PilM family ATPase